jgi:hypothetical protein
MEAGATEGASSDGGAISESSAGSDGSRGWDSAGGPDGTDGSPFAGCTPEDGTYTVTYTATEVAGTGCAIEDGGSTVVMETFPAPAEPADAAASDDGGPLAGCTCTGSSLMCTFTSTLRGTSTSTVTVSETITATGWTGTISDVVRALDGGMIYLCTQSVTATKN